MAGSRQGDKQLLRRLVFVAVFFEVGLLLLVLPWSGFWDDNYFAGAWPWLRPIVTNNFVRGGISGLGLVNLVVGLTDLIGVYAARRRPEIEPTAPDRLG